MRFEFQIGDRLRTVEIRRDDGGYQVTVDGRPMLVDAVRVDDDRWSLLVRDLDGQGQVRSVEAAVVPHIGSNGMGNGTVDVHVDGYHIPVQLKSGIGRRARGTSGAIGTGPQRVVAPMPGKVVRVLVKPGDVVKARQGLVVVEAMKMENELRASRDGRVRDVSVTEGQSVDAGTALVVVE